MNTKQSAILNPRITRKTDKITATYFQHLSLFFLFFSYNNNKKKIDCFRAILFPWEHCPRFALAVCKSDLKQKVLFFFFCRKVLSAITIKALLSNYINLTVSRHVKYSFCMHFFKKKILHV